MNIIDKINKAIAEAEGVEIVSINLNQEDADELYQIQRATQHSNYPSFPPTLLSKLGRDATIFYSEVTFKHTIDGPISATGSNRTNLTSTYYLDTGAKVTPGVNTKSPQPVWTEQYKNAKVRADADKELDGILANESTAVEPVMVTTEQITKSKNLKCAINYRINDVLKQIDNTKEYIDTIIEEFDFDTNEQVLLSAAKNTLVTLEIEELTLKAILERL